MPAGDFSSLDWARVDLAAVPHIVVPPPGPIVERVPPPLHPVFQGPQRPGQAVPGGF